MLSLLNMGPQRYSVLLYLIFMSASVYGDISIIPSTGEIFLGATKSLLCKVPSGKEAALKWTTSDDEDIEDEEGRYKVNKIDESILGLSVIASQWEPDRVIKCLGEYESGETVQAQIMLKIIEKPQFVGKLEREQTVMAGSSVQLPCSAKGIPAPAISWIHNGVTVPSSQGHLFVTPEGTLTLDKITLSDAGVYSCRASIESRNEEEYKNVTITVNAAPVIPDQESRINATVKSAVSLSCSVTGHPRPAISWKRGEEAISHDEQKYILSDDGQKLLINQLDKSDEGEYTCNANNLFGDSSFTLFVQVEDAAQSLGKGVVVGIVLLILLLVLLLVDLTCYRTKRRGFLMCIATNLLGKQTPGVKLEDEDIKKTSVDKSQVVNISGIEA
ncbi:neural cell adhesion molecule 1 [Bombina bombina]|uniref:neural cell adhesion molecule 1 n=1 Tax=Bombina bombina TaxID=8345 RepID=UPI00235AD7D1|nr:neural cell adhesion molecule 1 [Bombina bombina]